MTLLAAGLGMFMLFTRDIQTAIVFVCILLLLVLAFNFVGSVRLREMIAGLRRKYTISNQKKQEIESFENIELYFRQAKIFDQWWQAVCFAADRMDFVRSSLPLTNRDGTKRVLAWGKNGKGAPVRDIVGMTLPVRDRRSGPSLNLKIEVYKNGSLESAGRRMAFFARLIGEYSVATLPNGPDNMSISRLGTERSLVSFVGEYDKEDSGR